MMTQFFVKSGGSVFIPATPYGVILLSDVRNILLLPDAAPAVRLTIEAIFNAA